MAESRDLDTRDQGALAEWRTLVDGASGCTNCELYAEATQTVFGEGPVPARAMLVGEEPGDQEDLTGQPFVGPAGKLLNRALAEAGVVREELYLTNVVKHFKWTPRGKRRLHQRPNATEIAACRPWLEAELALVQPELLVLLGATAAQALLGSTFRVSRQRGQQIESAAAPRVVATIHPSAVLRAEDREGALAGLVDDLRYAFGLLDDSPPDGDASQRRGVAGQVRG